MRRQLILLALAAVALGLLLGCTKNGEQPPQPEPNQQAPQGNDLDASITAAATNDLPQDDVNSDVTDLEKDLSSW